MIEMILVFRLYSIFEVCAKNESFRLKLKSFTIFYIFLNRSIDLILHQKQCIGTIYHFELHSKGCTHSCINYLLTLKICSMAFLTISLAFGMLESRTGVMACRMLKLQLKVGWATRSSHMQVRKYSACFKTSSSLGIFLFPTEMIRLRMN